MWFSPVAKVANLAVSFPNQSRSYDATRRAIQFWGYDRSMERSFFVTEAALKHIQPDLKSDVPGLLCAFDSNRGRIHAAASKVYARDRRGSCEINVADVS